MDSPSSSFLTTARIMAHEMGHNFGLNHVDEVEGCQCASGDCIMRSTGIGNLWNDCSKKNMTRLLPSVALECLKNTPDVLPVWEDSKPNCGNFITEEGEECDCGPEKYCDNPCCDPQNCKRYPNATCATGPCCDTQTCKPRTAASVCRPALSECDTAEYCSGVDENCGADYFVRDGTSCDWGQGYCYEGRCGNPEARCKQVWGEGATVCPAEHVKRHNAGGTPSANCGFKNRAEEQTRACAERDAECGTLHCKTPEKASPGNYFHLTIWKADADDCRSILAKKEYAESAWLVPDGTPCGNGEMCVSQQCVSRPWPLSAIVFVIVLVVAVILVFLLWDHIRHCWERQGGRHLCVTHCYYCGTCLDHTCCPCMNKINRLMLSVLPVVKCPSLKMPPKQTSADANGAVMVAADGPDDIASVRTTRDSRTAHAPPEIEPEPECDVGVGRLEFLGSGVKGVSFSPVSPAPQPPTSTPGTPQLATPLLHTSQQSAPLQHPQFELQGGLSSNNFGVSDQAAPSLQESQSSASHIVPARQAPPPPRPTQTRPTPQVPPRPITTQPLRPSLPAPLSPPKVPPRP